MFESKGLWQPEIVLPFVLMMFSQRSAIATKNNAACSRESSVLRMEPRSKKTDDVRRLSGVNSEVVFESSVQVQKVRPLLLMHALDEQAVLGDPRRSTGPVFIGD